MNKQKIFNDPVYGFVHISFDILFDLIQHPWFQRLRRISQLGMTHLTYPGAVHTRFHHALGALHLMNLALEVLRQKGTEISQEEAEAASIAILFHDIGHGPFSHALEARILPVHHEQISLQLLELLNDQFLGRLTMAIQIFTNSYPKQFLHQLISSQLDLDRMDYLNRDSFYTGVMEGKIGFDRIIKMLRVVDDQLVIEEKGLASIEKFLVARKIMYLQVYLHKTVLAAETMLIAALERAKTLRALKQFAGFTAPMDQLFGNAISYPLTQSGLESFLLLDDTDILFFLKQARYHEDKVLQTFSQGLIDRNLFQVKFYTVVPPESQLEIIRTAIAQHFQIDKEESRHFLITGQETVDIYSPTGEIKILLKNQKIQVLSSQPDFEWLTRATIRNFICAPKTVSLPEL